MDSRDPALYAERVDFLLRRPDRAQAMGRAAAAGAQSYSWSITAARLRRLNADLAARRLVECR